MSKESDYDRLRDIWESRTLAGSKHSSKLQREKEVRMKLQDLALSLHRDNYHWAAEAIASFLLEKTHSLDEAFGLKQSGRGKPRSKTTLNRDADVLQARIGGMSLKSISRDTGMDRADVRRLCNGEGAFARRRDAALAAILGRRLDENNKSQME